MPNRVLKDSIRQSMQIDSLTWFQEVMFYRLIVTVDDYGRYYANPQIIKSKLFPMKEDLTKKAVETGLDKLEEVGLITRYEYDDNQYLEITKWGLHQQIRATKSKFPDANGSYVVPNVRKRNQRTSDDGKVIQMKPIDIIGNQLISNDCSGNQLSPYTKSKSKTETNNTRDPLPLEDDETLIAIQQDHDRILDKAKSAGLPSTEDNQTALLDLYNEYGLEKVLYGLNEASRMNKVSIAYVASVVKNNGRDRNENSGRMTKEETEAMFANVIF